MSSLFKVHRPMVMGTHWMITADHPLAAQAGAAVLEAGGNAMDAAVAANLLMAVVRPHMCGLGGDLFALIYLAEQDRLEALNASGRAPSPATIDFLRNQGLDAIPGHGLRSATVPGAIDGWEVILSKYGTMPLDRLATKAIDLAEHGFPVYEELRQAARRACVPCPMIPPLQHVIFYRILTNTGGSPLTRCGRRINLWFL